LLLPLSVFGKPIIRVSSVNYARPSFLQSLENIIVADVVVSFVQSVHHIEDMGQSCWANLTKFQLRKGKKFAFVKNVMKIKKKILIKLSRPFPSFCPFYQINSTILSGTVIE